MNSSHETARTSQELISNLWRVQWSGLTGMPPSAFQALPWDFFSQHSGQKLATKIQGMQVMSSEKLSHPGQCWHNRKRNLLLFSLLSRNPKLYQDFQWEKEPCTLLTFYWSIDFPFSPSHLEISDWLAQGIEFGIPGVVIIDNGQFCHFLEALQGGVCCRHLAVRR